MTTLSRKGDPRLIDKKSRVPLYAQLIDIIVKKVNSGELKEHDKLPSEREICEQYDISRTTTRQAMIELEQDGYIYKEHGKGSFVSPKTYTQSLVRMYSFTEEMKKLGKIPKAKILSFSIKPGLSKVATKLCLDEGELVYEMLRLRLADDEPIMYETTYLPCKHFPNLMKNDFEINSMYDLFLKKYSFTISSAQESFRVVSVGPEEAPYLLNEIGSPAMKIERVAFSKDCAVEYTVSVARGDRYVYTTELK